MRNYEDLKIWERAHKLCLSIYVLAENFLNNEKFGLTSQIKRASSSVAINMAKGCGYDTSKEFSRFLKIASSSIIEVSHILRLSKNLKFISDKNFNSLNEETIIRQMLYNLRMSQLK